MSILVALFLYLIGHQYTTDACANCQDLIIAVSRGKATDILDAQGTIEIHKALIAFETTCNILCEKFAPRTLILRFLGSLKVMSGIW